MVVIIETIEDEASTYRFGKHGVETLTLFALALTPLEGVVNFAYAFSTLVVIF